MGLCVESTAECGSRCGWIRRAELAVETVALTALSMPRVHRRYAAGLAVAFLSFVPLCQPGSIDGPALQV